MRGIDIDRQAKVTENNLLCTVRQLSEEDIKRLQITMNDAVLMCILDSAAQLAKDAQRFTQGIGVSNGESPLEITASRILHDNIRNN